MGLDLARSFDEESVFMDVSGINPGMDFRKAIDDNVASCGVLLAIGVVTVESVRRMGEPALAGKDAHGIWELALALLLPPFYALAAPAAVYLLIQWRVRRTVAHRRALPQRQGRSPQLPRPPSCATSNKQGHPS